MQRGHESRYLELEKKLQYTFDELCELTILLDHLDKIPSFLVAEKILVSYVRVLEQTLQEEHGKQRCQILISHFEIKHFADIKHETIFFPCLSRIEHVCHQHGLTKHVIFSALNWLEEKQELEQTPELLFIAANLYLRNHFKLNSFKYLYKDFAQAKPQFQSCVVFLASEQFSPAVLMEAKNKRIPILLKKAAKDNQHEYYVNGFMGGKWLLQKIASTDTIQVLETINFPSATESKSDNALQLTLRKFPSTAVQQMSLILSEKLDGYSKQSKVLNLTNKLNYFSYEINSLIDQKRYAELNCYCKSLLVLIMPESHPPEEMHCPSFFSQEERSSEIFLDFVNTVETLYSHSNHHLASDTPNNFRDEIKKQTEVYFAELDKLGNELDADKELELAKIKLILNKQLIANFFNLIELDLLEKYDHLFYKTVITCINISKECIDHYKQIATNDEAKKVCYAECKEQLDYFIKTILCECPILRAEHSVVIAQALLWISSFLSLEEAENGYAIDLVEIAIRNACEIEIAVFPSKYDLMYQCLFNLLLRESFQKDNPLLLDNKVLTELHHQQQNHYRSLVLTDDSKSVVIFDLLKNDQFYASFPKKVLALHQTMVNLKRKMDLSFSVNVHEYFHTKNELGFHNNYSFNSIFRSNFYVQRINDELSVLSKEYENIKLTTHITIIYSMLSKLLATQANDLCKNIFVIPSIEICLMRGHLLNLIEQISPQDKKAVISEITCAQTFGDLDSKRVEKFSDILSMKFYLSYIHYYQNNFIPKYPTEFRFELQGKLTTLTNYLKFLLRFCNIDTNVDEITYQPSSNFATNMNGLFKDPRFAKLLVSIDFYLKKFIYQQLNLYFDQQNIHPYFKLYLLFLLITKGKRLNAEDAECKIFLCEEFLNLISNKLITQKNEDINVQIEQKNILNVYLTMIKELIKTKNYKLAEVKVNRALGVFKDNHDLLFNKCIIEYHLLKQLIANSKQLKLIKAEVTLLQEKIFVINKKLEQEAPDLYQNSKRYYENHLKDTLEAFDQQLLEEEVQEKFNLLRNATDQYDSLKLMVDSLDKQLMKNFSLPNLPDPQHEFYVILNQQQMKIINKKKMLEALFTNLEKKLQRLAQYFEKEQDLLTMESDTNLISVEKLLENFIANQEAIQTLIKALEKSIDQFETEHAFLTELINDHAECFNQSLSHQATTRSPFPKDQKSKDQPKDIFHSNEDAKKEQKGIKITKAGASKRQNKKKQKRNARQEAKRSGFKERKTTIVENEEVKTQKIARKKVEEPKPQEIVLQPTPRKEKMDRVILTIPLPDNISNEVFTELHHFCQTLKKEQYETQITGSVATYITMQWCLKKHNVESNAPFTCADIDFQVLAHEHYNKEYFDEFLKAGKFHQQMVVGCDYINVKDCYTSDKIQLDITIIKDRSYFKEDGHFLFLHYVELQFVDEKDLIHEDLNYIVRVGDFYLKLMMKKGMEEVIVNACLGKEFLIKPLHKEIRCCYVLYKNLLKMRASFPSLDFTKKISNTAMMTVDEFFKRGELISYFLINFNEGNFDKCYKDMKRLFVLYLEKKENLYSHLFFTNFFFSLLTFKLRQRQIQAPPDLSSLAENCSRTFLNVRFKAEEAQSACLVNFNHAIDQVANACVVRCTAFYQMQSQYLAAQHSYNYAGVFFSAQPSHPPTEKNPIAQVEASPKESSATSHMGNGK